MLFSNPISGSRKCEMVPRNTHRFASRETHSKTACIPNENGAEYFPLVLIGFERRRKYASWATLEAVLEEAISRARQALRILWFRDMFVQNRCISAG